MDCTCTAGYRGEVYHCPLHAAALEIYGALKGLTIAYNIDEQSVIVNQDPVYWQRAIKALTKAEGKNETIP